MFKSQKLKITLEDKTNETALIITVGSVTLRPVATSDMSNILAAEKQTMMIIPSSLKYII